MDIKMIEEGTELYVQFDKRGGTVPTIAQDAATGLILMLAYTNAQSLEETLKTGYATFWRTKTQELWKKGETSGDVLRIVQILVDCDQDALVYKVQREGSGACHTTNQQGRTRESCFYISIECNKKLRYL